LAGALHGPAWPRQGDVRHRPSLHGPSAARGRGTRAGPPAGEPACLPLGRCGRRLGLAGMKGGDCSSRLAGVRVVDRTMFVAGPFCTMLLADLGADVVKVEPLEGDPVRSSAIGPTIGGASAQFHSYNRGKRSIAINLKAPAGREAFLDL